MKYATAAVIIFAIFGALTIYRTNRPWSEKTSMKYETFNELVVVIDD